MKKFFVIFLGLFWVGINGAWAHFLVFVPEKDLLSFPQKDLKFTLVFTHPMEGGPAMPLARPQKVGLWMRGQRLDLTGMLKQIKWPLYASWRGENDHSSVPAWQFIYHFKHPGDHIFYVIPAPYFEPAEGVFIQQITKVIVNAFEAEVGWDTYLGLPVEIVPLTRPYGLWEGNLFCGRVLKEGKPLRGARVEVEFLNDGAIKEVSGPFTTQVLKTNEAGEFCYTIPWAGWWGFAVLSEGTPLKKDGKVYPLELDAVLWLKAYPKPVKRP